MQGGRFSRVTGTGERSPGRWCVVGASVEGGSRHGAGGALANFPASRLLDFSTCWLVGVVTGAGGGCVCGYSEALMRISERGCIRAAE